jgi:non-heme chloroperoxidase
MPSIEARDGTHIHVKDMGTGEAVLLIHGWPLTGDMFEYQTLALLESGFRVITYDRRGFGQSGHPSVGYDYDTFADDLDSVIKGLRLTKVSLIGFSMGGGEVARYAARHGTENIRKAVLISAVTPYLLKGPSNPDGVDAAVFEGMQQGVRKDRFDFLQTFGKMFYGVGLVTRPVSSALLAWTFQLAVMASPKATIDCVSAFGTTDFRPDLKFLKIPTLIIHGTSDDIVPIDVSARQAVTLIPQSSLIEYEGEPHGLLATAPARLNDDLLRFLRK